MEERKTPQDAAKMKGSSHFHKVNLFAPSLGRVPQENCFSCFIVLAPPDLNRRHREELR